MTNTPSNHQPGRPDHIQRGGSVPTVVCHICQAVYAPAEEYRYLSQAPHVALESAFMSMCHFCFRCRRPACPQCWDTIHGVCGECSLEANLPFRSQAAPLRGVLFPSTRQAQLRRKRAETIRLICINPGRFQKLAPIDEAETMPYLKKARTRDLFAEPEEPTSSHAPRPTSLIPSSRQSAQTPAPYTATEHPAIQPGNPAQTAPHIGRITRDFQATNGQQDQGKQTEWLPPATSIIPTGKVKRPFSLSSPAAPSTTSGSLSSAHITARQPSNARVLSSQGEQSSAYIQKQPSNQNNGSTIAIEDIITRPERPAHKSKSTTNTSTSQHKQLAERETSAKRPATQVKTPPEKARRTIAQSIEILLTSLLSTLVLIILILVVVASVSPNTNTFIFHLTSIDIHSELQNLWRLIHG